MAVMVGVPVSMEVPPSVHVFLIVPGNHLVMLVGIPVSKEEIPIVPVFLIVQWNSLVGAPVSM